MSKVIRLNENTYRRLESLIHGFDDTPDAIVQRLLDHYEGSSKQPLVNSSHTNNEVAPDLTHTKIIDGHFAGTKFKKWSELLHLAHKKAFDTMESFDKLSAESLSNLELGETTESGFKPVSGTPFSIQGASANDSWKSALHLAKLLDVPVYAEVRWREKAGAFRPGGSETLNWSPS